MRFGLGCCRLGVALALGGCAVGADPSAAPLPTATPVIDDSAPAPEGTFHVVFYPRVGSLIDDQWGAIGPGVVLMNGGLAPTSVFPWMHETVDPNRIAGDVVVLSTRGGDVYSAPIYAAAPFNSVQTVLVPRNAPSSDIALVAELLANAEIVFLADGDLPTYANWARTPMGDAVNAVYDRGGVVAGSGAGAAALGAVVLTSQTDSATALADPYATSITLVQGAFGLPLMAGTFVDLAFQAHDRFGVVAAMTARSVVEGLTSIAGAPPMGIGLGLNSALTVSRQGIVTLVDDGVSAGSAWIVNGGKGAQVEAGMPLVWPAAPVTRFDTAGESLTILASCGTAFSYDVAIDGSAPTPYTPADPYDAEGTSNPCPL